MEPVCTEGGLVVAFNPMYSAFIPGGKHTFLIPAVVYGSTGSVTWSADTSIVAMQPDPDNPNGVRIQTLQAGTVTINLQSDDGKCGSAQLNITPFQEADWQLGNDRYNKGQPLPPSTAMLPDGSYPNPFELGDAAPACTLCHGDTATFSTFQDVSHTPEQTGGFSDKDLINIVVRGTVPDGGYFDRTIVPYGAWQAFHQWTDIRPEQENGIVVYLRSLTPQRQKGTVNFGAIGMDAAGLGTGSGPAD
jgi:hypothetical protein